jgi:hypothetical protein
MKMKMKIEMEMEMEMSDESHEKGRKKMSMTREGRCAWGDQSHLAGRAQQITDARTNNIVLYSKLTPPLILASNSH